MAKSSLTLANAPKRRRSVTKGNNKHWAQQQKLECVLAYIATGSESHAAAVTGIPKTTIHDWRYQPWWKELVQQIHDEQDDAHNASIQKIIDKAINTVQDRLDHGDFQYDQKTGELIRKPINLRDGHKVLVDMIDKRNLLTGKPTSRVEQVDTKNQLEFLAKKFAEFATMSKRELNNHLNEDTVIDVDATDVEDTQDD